MRDKPVPEKKREEQLSSKINTSRETPVFSDAQLTTFKSDYVDSLDEALAVLDENNRNVIGQTKAFAANKDTKKQ